jgi:hypothetical protein
LKTLKIFFSHKMALIKTIPESILKKRKQNEQAIQDRVAKRALVKKVFFIARG